MSLQLTTPVRLVREANLNENTTLQFELTGCPEVTVTTHVLRDDGKIVDSFKGQDPVRPDDISGKYFHTQYYTWDLRLGQLSQKCHEVFAICVTLSLNANQRSLLEALTRPEPVRFVVNLGGEELFNMDVTECVKNDKALTNEREMNGFVIFREGFGHDWSIASFKDRKWVKKFYGDDNITGRLLTLEAYGGSITRAHKWNSIKVSVVAAMRLAPKDFGGTSDPYVKITVEQKHQNYDPSLTIYSQYYKPERMTLLEKVQTNVVPKNLNPIFTSDKSSWVLHRRFLDSAFEGRELIIKALVMDKNVLFKDSFEGYCEWHISELELAKLKSATEDNGRSMEVWLPLTNHPNFKTKVKTGELKLRITIEE